jgi:hypothetical protein
VEVQKCTSIHPVVLHEEFISEMSDVLIDFLGNMFQKLVHNDPVPHKPRLEYRQRFLRQCGG